MFEAVAEVCGWPVAERAIRLLSLLTGEAQTAALGLPPASRNIYADVRKAILDRLGLSPEEHRRRFREARLEPEDRILHPCPAARWLQPGSSAGEQVLLEKVVMEQFVGGLPVNTSACHRPASLKTAIILAEDHLAVHPSGSEDNRCPLAPAQLTPAPRRRSQRQLPGQPLPSPQSHPLPLVVSPQVPAVTGTLPNLQGAPQTLGQECWRCDRPGHCRKECPLLDVGQVIRVAGPPTPSPGPGVTYRSDVPSWSCMSLLLSSPPTVLLFYLYAVLFCLCSPLTPTSRGRCSAHP
ncbi:uncharacterized protein [Brachyistius frenatus]|uniref:uncharacterized protein n=1 Tax=Brachyistius frenatus TaxID=100188 RepID=UPI0037E75F32